MKRAEAFYAAVLLTVFAFIAITFFSHSPAICWVLYVIACEASNMF